MPKKKKSSKRKVGSKLSKFVEFIDRPSASTPHQKTMTDGIGKQKASGMGKVARIGAKKKKS